MVPEGDRERKYVFMCICMCRQFFLALKSNGVVHRVVHSVGRNVVHQVGVIVFKPPQDLCRLMPNYQVNLVDKIFFITYQT